MDAVKLGMEMFLGITLGKWEITKTPTLDNTDLVLTYKGTKGNARPFRILSASARPPKRYKSTNYWCNVSVDLQNETITFSGLRSKVTPPLLMIDLEMCLEKSKSLRDNRVKKVPCKPGKTNVDHLRDVLKAMDTKYQTKHTMNLSESGEVGSRYWTLVVSSGALEFSKVGFSAEEVALRAIKYLRNKL
jgi:hypothetical protein